MSVLYLNICRLCVPDIMSLGIKLHLVELRSWRDWYSVKIRVIFGVRFERRNVDNKQTYVKTETHKLCSRVFWIFMPNVIKIDPYTFELYGFKVGAFF